MKVIISAAGLGTRLWPLTKRIPKANVKINGQSIIERNLRSFKQNGVNEAVIIVGFLGGQVRDRVRRLDLDLKTKFIFNPLYNYHGCGYSFFLAAEEFRNSETIFMEGDLVFDSRLYSLLVENRCKNVVLVDRHKIDKKRSVVVLGEKGIVEKFVYDPNHRDVFSLVPDRKRVLGESMQMWRFSKAASNFLARELKNCLDRVGQERDPRSNLYPINRMIKKFPMYCIDGRGLKWFNINTVEDIKKAEKFLKGKD